MEEPFVRIASAVQGRSVVKGMNRTEVNHVLDVCNGYHGFRHGVDILDTGRIQWT